MENCMSAETGYNLGYFSFQVYSLFKDLAESTILKRMFTVAANNIFLLEN